MFAFKGLSVFVPGCLGAGRWAQRVATMVAIYGGCMELNALLHTVRTFTIGLAYIARDNLPPPNGGAGKVDRAN
jgi:hypothetical protein